MNERVEMKVRLQEALDNANKKAVDLSRDLKIPKSAISQYTSGTRTIKDSTRLYAIAKYLNVSEPWLMGFDVPMERPQEQKENDELVDLIEKLRSDRKFRHLVVKLNNLNSEQLEGLMKLMNIPLE